MDEKNVWDLSGAQSRYFAPRAPAPLVTPLDKDNEEYH